MQVNQVNRQFKNIDYIVSSYNGFEIIVRKTDNYFNASRLINNINKLAKEMQSITLGSPREEIGLTDFSLPIKAMSMTYGIDADVNLTAEDYKYAQNDFTLSDKSNIDLELEALCKVAVVSSAKNGGIFTINPKINLNTENSSKLLELAVKGSDPSAYLGVLDNVFDIKIIVQDKDGKETYSDTFKISDVIEIISQISNTVN